VSPTASISVDLGSIAGRHGAAKVAADTNAILHLTC